MNVDTLKVAIVADWLATYAGSEKVLEQILNIFPQADLFSVVDFIPEGKRNFLKNKTVNTSFIQKLPFARKKFRAYLPFMPIAVEQLDVSDYQLVISSSHAVAKGVITGPDQLHICYCHSPIRYAWDLQNQYLKESNLTKGIKSILARYMLFKIRNWDYRTANGVDIFLANSDFIRKRIWKIYRRKAKVVYPPVNIEKFPVNTTKKQYYFTASRMVPYKRVSLIVEAFSEMPEKELYVIGDGSEFEKVSKMATANVHLLGYQQDEILIKFMTEAKAFVFAAEEDFGIIPVEAQACGTPVIAYGRGGSLETVIADESDGAKTGVFFEEQTTQSIVAAVHRFEANINDFNPTLIRQNALRFSEESFRQKFKKIVQTEIEYKLNSQNNIHSKKY